MSEISIVLTIEALPYDLEKRTGSERYLAGSTKMRFSCASGHARVARQQDIATSRGAFARASVCASLCNSGAIGN